MRRQFGTGDGRKAAIFLACSGWVRSSRSGWSGHMDYTVDYTDVLRQGLGEWSPNGKFLAGAQQNRLQIREHESLKLLQVFICLDKVERIEWSPDSQLILTEVARPGVLQIWSMRDSEWTCRIYEGLAGIAHAWWADAETVLVTVDFQLYLSIWQLQEGSSAIQIPRPKFRQRGVAFSRDGCWLAALRRVECKDKLSVYNAEGKFTCLTDVTLPGDAANLLWGPDDNTLVVWEMPGRLPWCRMYTLAGECLVQLGDGFPRSVVASPSTALLAACGVDGQLQLLSAVSQKIVASFSHALDLSECDDEVFLWEEDFEMNEPGGLRYRRLQDCLWTLRPIFSQVALEQEKTDFPRLEERIGPDIPDADGIPRQGITVAQWSPDERYLATKHESFPSVVWIWDLGKMVLASLLCHNSSVKSVVWDPMATGERSRLAISTSDPVLFLWSPHHAEALPSALSAARLRWRSDGRSLLLQERDRCCHHLHHHSHGPWYEQLHTVFLAVKCALGHSMDDDVCKLLTDLVRSSMKRCHQDQSDPEPITTWGLYVGGMREANNLEMLQRLHISAVVNASPDVVHVDYPKQWHVLTVDAEDDEFYPLLETHLEAVVEFVDQQRAEKRPVLLHCFAGMNRSAALCAAYLMVKERIGLFRVVKLLSEKRGWILSNDGFMHQLVRLAREEELLDPMPSPRLDAVAEEPHEPHEPHEMHKPHQDVCELEDFQRTRARSSSNTAAPRCHASKLGRSLSRMSIDGEADSSLQRGKTKLERRLSRSSSAMSDVSEEGGRKVPRTSDQPLRHRTISDKELGYASRLPRQDSISSDLKKIKALKDLREGTAKLQPGMYLYVIMLGDPEYIRLIHEDHLVHEGVLAGHTSLVERNEFRRGWAKQWNNNDPEVRHTVLYAGELEYEQGVGVTMWNNHSGHYTPSAKDHVRVHLDPSTFVPYDEEE
eukprot:s59_g6.t1